MRAVAFFHRVLSAQGYSFLGLCVAYTEKKDRRISGRITVDVNCLLWGSKGSGGKT